MSDPDNFLTRWSRRKRKAANRLGKDVGLQPEKDKDNETTASSARDEPANPGKSISAPPAPPAPEFDVSKLPPIESIGADTDISAFMKRGVPSALRHAALRRAWSADPAIRNFVGLNENFWDAAGPDGIPGFGDLDPGFDVKRMVAELFGEPRSKEADTPVDQVPAAENSADSRATPLPPDAGEGGPEDLARPAGNAAAQQDSPQSQPPKRIARRHGGAMPQ